MSYLLSRYPIKVKPLPEAALNLSCKADLFYALIPRMGTILKFSIQKSILRFDPNRIEPQWGQNIDFSL